MWQNSILCSNYGVQIAAATFFQFGGLCNKICHILCLRNSVLLKFLPLHRGGIQFITGINGSTSLQESTCHSVNKMQCFYMMSMCTFVCVSIKKCKTF